MVKKKDKVSRGDIWQVDLGYGEGSEQRGKKPCLVVQNDLGNKHASTTIIIPLTSKKKKFNKTHVKIENHTLMISYALCEQIRVISTKRLMKKLSVVSSVTMDEINEKLKIQLGII